MLVNWNLSVSYWYILIPILFYFLLLIANIKRRGVKISLYNSLILLYILSLLANILTGLYYERNFRIDGILYFILTTYLFVYPFNKVNIAAFSNLPFINKKKYYVLSIIFIILNFLSILKSIPKIPEALFALTSNNVYNYRIYLSAQIMSATEKGIVRVIVDWSHATFFIPITLFFVGLIKKARVDILILLFISSLSVLLFYLVQLGRTGVMLYFVCLFFNYLIFYKFLPSRILTIFRRSFFIFLPLLITPFIIISTVRFTGGYRQISDSSVAILVSLLDYLGQGFVNFDIFYRSNFDHYSYGVQMFPLFYRVLYKLGFTSYDYHEMYEYYKVTYPYSWYYFSTFLREFWYNFGPLGTFLTAIVFNLFIRKVNFRLRKRVTVHNILWLYVGFNMVAFSLFSLNLAQMSENFALLLILLIGI